MDGILLDELDDDELDGMDGILLDELDDDELDGMDGMLCEELCVLEDSQAVSTRLIPPMTIAV